MTRGDERSLEKAGRQSRQPTHPGSEKFLSEMKRRLSALEASLVAQWPAGEQRRALLAIYEGAARRCEDALLANEPPAPCDRAAADWIALAEAWPNATLAELLAKAPDDLLQGLECFLGAVNLGAVARTVQADAGATP